MQIIKNLERVVEDYLQSLDLKECVDKSNIEKYAAEDFKAGVSFAEKELGDLAIEFVEWVGENFYKNYRDEDDSFWMNSKKLSAYTTKELFEIFKQEKYEHEH